MALPFSKEEAKRILRELLQDPELRSVMEEELSGYFAAKQPTEKHLQRLYEEVLHQREQSEKRWEAWKAESDARWQKWIAEAEARWEAWKAEDRRKWEEWKTEDKRKWEEWKAENERRWQENQRKWEENQRRWEEWKAENERRWQENQRKWEESQRKWEESQQRWEENQRRWEENQRRLDEHQKYLEALYQKLEDLDRAQRVSIGAIGARWGLATEYAFRESMKAILERDFGVQVEQYLNYDTEGVVFTRPDQVELDLIIYDSKVLVAEIKSSMSRPDVHAFLNKVAFYERKEGRPVTRKLIISPMVRPEAVQLAKAHGVEVYAYPTEKQLKKGPRKRKTPPPPAIP